MQNPLQERSGVPSQLISAISREMGMMASKAVDGKRGDVQQLQSRAK